ncbi:MAG: PLP-dependent aminotransferase family protein [Oscillospiraceae bacterium]|nr:PLP-dependent aminotransferase family protein [Oscillospiraceae bacterium]
MFNFIFTADKESKKPLYEQLYSYVANEIRNNNLTENERMPSKKALAKHLGISVNTVETAYSILVEEGYLRSVPRSGFYVCRIEAPMGGREIEYAEEKAPVKKYKTDFKTNTVDVASFPYATWVKLSKEVLYSNPEYLNAGDVKGDYELCESIAKYLHEFRGVRCSPAQIVVGAGIEYLTMLLTELFDEKSVFALENPGYRKINAILKNNNRRINYIDVDETGLRTDKLKESDSDIVYVTPSHQFPTGAVMSVGRRTELLSWAEEKDGRYIIEDDYNSEFNFSVKPVPAMQGLAVSDKVIYLSTFSRVLAPSIRIAYMVLPKEILKKFDEHFSAYSSTVPRFEQHTLDRFISDGYFSRHLSRVKNIYRKRRDRLMEILDGTDFTITGERAGLHLVLKTPHAKEIIKKAEQNDIKLYDMDDYYMTENKCGNSVIIGYAGASEEDMERLGKFFEKYRY